jgi:hypothetical protein
MRGLKTGGSSREGETARPRSCRKTTQTKTIVIATDTIHATPRRCANVTPLTGSSTSTIRFVRFAPGRRREAAFAMNTLP